MRCLAALLLMVLACGTVAEYTHNHSDRSNGSQLNVGTANAAYNASNAIQSDDATKTSSRSKSAAECLICQLHQNLSNTTFTHTLAVGPTETQLLAFNTTVDFHRAGFSASQRGRAPPTNL